MYFVVLISNRHKSVFKWHSPPFQVVVSITNYTYGITRVVRFCFPLLKLIRDFCFYHYCQKYIGLTKVSTDVNSRMSYGTVIIRANNIANALLFVCKHGLTVNPTTVPTSISRTGGFGTLLINIQYFC